MAANKLVAQFTRDELGLLNALQKQGIVVALRSEGDQYSCWARFLDNRREPVTGTGRSKAESIRAAASNLDANLPEVSASENAGSEG